MQLQPGIYMEMQSKGFLLDIKPTLTIHDFVEQKLYNSLGFG